MALKRTRRPGPCGGGSGTGAKMRAAQRQTTTANGQTNTTFRPKRRLTALQRAAIARANRARAGKSTRNNAAKNLMRCAQRRSGGATKRAIKAIATKRTG